MSLPSRMFFYDESSTCVAQAFINAGWYVDENSLFEAVKESFKELNQNEDNNSYYEKTSTWKEDTKFVKVYGLTLSRSILDRIIRDDQTVKQEIQSIIKSYNEMS